MLKKRKERFSIFNFFKNISFKFKNHLYLPKTYIKNKIKILRRNEDAVSFLSPIFILLFLFLKMNLNAVEIAHFKKFFLDELNKYLDIFFLIHQYVNHVDHAKKHH